MNVHDEFTRRVAADRLCIELMRAIAENDTAALERLGMRGFGQYAGRLSELMTDSVRRELLGADDFGAIMDEVAKPAHYAHHLVNEGGTAIQQALDKRQGIRLRVVEPEFNDGRLKGIVGEASESDSENAADNLATQLGTFVKDMGNEFMRQNAEQRDRAGFKVTVTRTGGAKCCPWCADRTGKWELANAPDGVFGCHDNCKCIVDYTNSKGAVSRRVGRSRFVDVAYEPPHRMTAEEAAKKGAFAAPKRLTGGANGGIIGSDKLNWLTAFGDGEIIDIALFKQALANGQVNTSIYQPDQRNHLTTPEWKNQVKQALANGGKPKSRLYKSVDPQSIVDLYSGTGIMVSTKKNQVVDEFMTMPFKVGVTYDKKLGRYVETHRVQIKYTKNGTHVFPVIEGGKKQSGTQN